MCSSKSAPRSVPWIPRRSIHTNSPSCRPSLKGAGCIKPMKQLEPSRRKTLSIKRKSAAFCKGKWGYTKGRRWVEGRWSRPIAVGFAGNSK
jgi:hypothetical protein